MAHENKRLAIRLEHVNDFLQRLTKIEIASTVRKSTDIRLRIGNGLTIHTKDISVLILLHTPVGGKRKGTIKRCGIDETHLLKPGGIVDGNELIRTLAGLAHLLVKRSANRENFLNAACLHAHDGESAIAIFQVDDKIVVQRCDGARFPALGKSEEYE